MTAFPATCHSIRFKYPLDWGEGRIATLREGERRELRPCVCIDIVPLYLKYREFGLGISDTISVNETGCEPFSQLGSQ